MGASMNMIMTDIDHDHHQRDQIVIRITKAVTKTPGEIADSRKFVMHCRRYLTGAELIFLFNYYGLTNLRLFAAMQNLMNHLYDHHVVLAKGGTLENLYEVSK